MNSSHSIKQQLFCFLISVSLLNTLDVFSFTDPNFAQKCARSKKDTKLIKNPASSNSFLNDRLLPALFTLDDNRNSYTPDIIWYSNSPGKSLRTSHSLLHLSPNHQETILSSTITNNSNKSSIILHHVISARNKNKRFSKCISQPFTKTHTFSMIWILTRNPQCYNNRGTSWPGKSIINPNMYQQSSLHLASMNDAKPQFNITSPQLIVLMIRMTRRTLHFHHIGCSPRTDKYTINKYLCHQSFVHCPNARGTSHYCKPNVPIQNYNSRITTRNMHSHHTRRFSWANKSLVNTDKCHQSSLHCPNTRKTSSQYHQLMDF